MTSKHHLPALLFLFLASLSCHLSSCTARHSWVEELEDLQGVATILERVGRCDKAPTRLTAVTKSTEYGGQSGDNFDIDRNQEPTTLQSILIRSDDSAVISLEFIYATKEGGTVRNGPFGGESGGVVHEITMSNSEHVTKIDGFYGKNEEGLVLIKSLTIFTNENTRGYGPYGPLEGTRFTIKGEAVAFFGHAGNYLYGFGAYVRT